MGRVTPVSEPTHRVPSTDGVDIALHDLGGDGPPVVLCHPTGFHGMVWAPVARSLAERFHCWALDFRGHGDSTLPASGDMRWQGMADDVLAVAAVVAPDGQPLLGVGHSMGGCAQVLAEQARPGTWAALWCYEPIVFPRPEGSTPGNFMAATARKRRSVFPSYEAAFANYHAKPPMNGFDPDALHAYVDYAFRPLPGGDADGDGAGEGVELKCSPETEARVFEGGIDNGAFPRLGEVACPVTVAAGNDGGPPAQMAPLVAEALQHGSLRPFPELTHFGPMEDPAAIARAITLDFVAVL